jgi:hypothetical protein
MDDTDDFVGGALVHIVDSRQQQQSDQREMAERAEHARDLADQARLDLAELAAPAVALIACQLTGVPNDWNDKPINKDRVDTAWEVLSRIGVPRLRATAIAASIAASTQAPAPDSPGWVPEADDDEDEAAELDPASIDGQIDAFIAGARAQRDLGTAS